MQSPKIFGAVEFEPAVCCEIQSHAKTNYYRLPVSSAFRSCLNNVLEIGSSLQTRHITSPL